VTGTMRSSAIEALLTEAEWTDRRLAVSKDIRVPNDRLWTVTGNNVQLGGDLRRRTVWITINPNMEAPETRTDFVHNDLPSWVEERRGDVLAALLGLVSRWVDAGRPMPSLERTDSFGIWQQAVSGVLAHAGVRGKVNHVDSVAAAGVSDEDEWGSFLAAVEARFGAAEWQVKQVIAAGQMGDGFENDDLPAEVAAKLSHHDDGLAAKKTLGAWVQNRADRWFDGRRVVLVGVDRKKTKIWRVVNVDTDLL